MPKSIRDRISAARRALFVGRQRERGLFRKTLGEQDLSAAVLFIFGPGGVGKSTLLQEYIHICTEAGVDAHFIDARDIEPSPDGFRKAYREALDLPDDTDLHTDPGKRRVLLIDTFERLGRLSRWLRGEFFPTLPADTLIVIAGRFPPSAAWRMDPGWRGLMQIIPLRNLNPEESRDYLTRRRIPADQHARILRFTHGHLMALSLVGDVYEQQDDLDFDPLEAPDIVRVLVERLLKRVPSPEHQQALEACALVHNLSESLLMAILQKDDVQELFLWLRRLSFIESGAAGLFPHDLAREVLDIDLQWRNPERRSELLGRARRYYADRIQENAPSEQRSILTDYIYLHRSNPIVQPFFEQVQSTSGGQDLWTDRMQPGELETLVDIVEKFEGPESARWAAYWIDQQPENVVVVRDGDGSIAGFLMQLSLADADPEARSQDPATRAAWDDLSRRTPLRPGERATLFRHWMASDSYQAISPAQLRVAINMIRHYLQTPGLAFSFLPCADPDFWLPIFTYADLNRMPEADFSLDGRTYGVFGHDWRAVPPFPWLDVLAERETSLSPGRPPAPDRSASLVVLSREEFGAAVKEVLQAMRKPADLSENPLLRSRLVVEKLGAEAGGTQRLLDLVEDAIQTLDRNEVDRKLYSALYRTYLQPARTQELAAEALDLPYGTYRHRLQDGVERVVEALWQVEIGIDR